MKKMVVCGSCGAEFERSLIRCPYCKTAYLPAEEEEYMGKLEGIHNELKDIPKNTEKKLDKKVFGFTGIVITLIITIVLLTAGAFFLSGITKKFKDRQEKKEFLQNQGVVSEQQEENEK